MKKRKYKIRRIILVVIIFISFISILFTGSCYLYNKFINSNNLYLARFNQIKVVILEGETLWEKQEKLLDEKEDIRKVLNYVKKINKKQNLSVDIGEEIILLEKK